MFNEVDVMIFFLQVGDRLFSAFGQDTIDALFWTATEPRKSETRKKKRESLGLVFHFAVGCGYVFLHALLVLLQVRELRLKEKRESNE